MSEQPGSLHGVPVPKLRLVYASTWHSRQAHMVLAYYSERNADPLILDNLQASLSPASKRPDLTPMFTFNEDDLLLMGGPGQPAGSLVPWRPP